MVIPSLSSLIGKFYYDNWNAASYPKFLVDLEVRFGQGIEALATARGGRGWRGRMEEEEERSKLCGTCKDGYGCCSDN